MNWYFLLNKIIVGDNLLVTLFLTLFIFIVTYFLGKFLSYVVIKFLQKLGNKKIFLKKNIISQIENPIGLISKAILWMVVLHFMPPLWKAMGGMPLFLSNPITMGVQVLIKLVIGSGLIWMVYNLVDELIMSFVDRFFKDTQNTNIKNHFVPFIIRFAKIIVLCFGSLLVLQSLGINVVSLMAGLGLGGVAIALAAKDSAANILAYVSIMMDRSFSVGDWISIDSIEGTVMEIGLRSTKLKTFYDSIVTVPNSTLTGASIDNLGKRKARRTRVYLGIQYDTPPEKIKNFIDGLKNILIKNSSVKKNYFQVYFTDFGPSELKIIMNFFLLVNSWENELQEKQNIFMNVLKLASELNVQFAFPTQSLHLESVPKEAWLKNILNQNSK